MKKEEVIKILSKNFKNKKEISIEEIGRLFKNYSPEELFEIINIIEYELEITINDEKKIKKPKINYESEFAKYSLKHKFTIIEMALTLFSDNLFEKLLIDKYCSNIEIDDDFRAAFTAKRLIKEAQTIGSLKIDAIYNMCWKKIAKFIPDNLSFNSL